MIIDFNSIEQQAIDRFKDGNGQLLTRNFVDSENKIMMSRLAPKSNIGYHSHDENSEVMYFFSGKGHVDYDGGHEDVKAGMVHYCPKGHSHALYNDSDSEELIYFAIVGEHH